MFDGVDVLSALGGLIWGVLIGAALALWFACWIQDC